jgi:hypothetical protein
MTGHNLPVDRRALTEGGWYCPPEARRFVNRPTRLW